VALATGPTDEEKEEEEEEEEEAPPSVGTLFPSRE